MLRDIEARQEEAERRREWHQASTLQLFDVGAKRNGMTSGIPVNPINHHYQDSYGGKQLQSQETEKQLCGLVRLHHLQTKNTCGYNPINGKENTPVTQLLPGDLQPDMGSRLGAYQQHYSIRPPYF
jgi:hypothetical protein